MLLFAAGSFAIGSSIYFRNKFASKDFYGNPVLPVKVEKSWFFQLFAGILFLLASSAFAFIKFKKEQDEMTQPLTSAAYSRAWMVR